MTVGQLQVVIDEVTITWKAWGVIDFHSGTAVENLGVINLYDVNNHLIKPKTAPFECSYVELVAREAQPPKWFISHWCVAACDPVVDIVGKSYPA